jgi:hypothetical protein
MESKYLATNKNPVKEAEEAFADRGFPHIVSYVLPSETQTPPGDQAKFINEVTAQIAVAGYGTLVTRLEGKHPQYLIYVYDPDHVENAKIGIRINPELNSLIADPDRPELSESGCEVMPQLGLFPILV